MPSDLPRRVHTHAPVLNCLGYLLEPCAPGSVAEHLEARCGPPPQVRGRPLDSGVPHLPLQRTLRQRHCPDGNAGRALRGFRAVKGMQHHERGRGHPQAETETDQHDLLEGIARCLRARAVRIADVGGCLTVFCADAAGVEKEQHDRELRASRLVPHRRGVLSPASCLSPLLAATTAAAAPRREERGWRREERGGERREERGEPYTAASTNGHRRPYNGLHQRPPLHRRPPKGFKSRDRECVPFVRRQTRSTGVGP